MNKETMIKAWDVLDRMEEPEPEVASLDKERRFFTVSLNGYAYDVLESVTARIVAKTGVDFTAEQVAEQLILRELRKVRR